MANFLVVGVGGGRDSVALKFESIPAEFFRACGSDRVPIGRAFFYRRNCLQGAVEADLVAESSAQEVDRGGLEELTGEIPKSDFDATGGGNRDAADCAGTGAFHEHFCVELVDVQWVFADDERLELGEDQVLDAGSPIGFANAGDAGVGLDLYQVPIPGAPDDHALDVGDLDLVFQGGGETVEWQCGCGKGRADKSAARKHSRKFI